MKALFKNPKAALAYVGVTMFSVWLFVGTEDDPGSLQQTVETFNNAQSVDREEGRRFGEGFSQSPEESELDPAWSPESEVTVHFASDEELIDTASGFDPNPPTEPPLLSEQDTSQPDDVAGGWSN